MHPKKIFIPLVFASLLTTLFFTFREEPKNGKPNTRMTTGTVEEIFTDGASDVVFKLKDNDHMYFIDEGLKNGLTLNSLRKELTGRPVEIYYLTRGTSVAALNKQYHITRTDMNESMLYAAVEVRSK